MTGFKRTVVLAAGISLTCGALALGAPQRRDASRGQDRYQLTGTYQLQNEGGDNPQRAAEQAASAVPPGQRQRTYESLLSRLESPPMLAIERRGSSVTMASSRGRPVTVDADGRDHQERWQGQQTMNTRATLMGERLVITTTGRRGSDFTVTFEPVQNGRSLRVTRTIDDESLRRPLTVRSLYRRVSEQARWDIDAGGAREPVDTGAGRGDVAVRDGTRLVALLDNPLSTKNVREGDRYTMTVRGPSEYEGAVIEGFVSSVSQAGGRNERAGMTLNLRSIRVRNGRSYSFEGVIEEMRTPDGQAVGLDREGAAASSEGQGQEAVERGAIGAALGALIGAVAGGGKGAAIGAVIGAGGGAATVLLNGRDQLDLPRGTELRIIAGDPRNQRTNPAERR